MDSVLWLAKIYGPLLVVFGAWLLTFSNEIYKSVSNTKNHSDTCNVIGFFNLFLGLLILSLFNSWTSDRTVLLTILGWVFILRALALLFTPRLIAKALLKHPGVARITGVIIFFWGLGIFSIVM